MTWVWTFSNNYSNHPRMCVLSSLCGNVDKHNTFLHIYMESLSQCRSKYCMILPTSITEAPSRIAINQYYTITSPDQHLVHFQHKNNFWHRDSHYSISWLNVRLFIYIKGILHWCTGDSILIKSIGHDCPTITCFTDLTSDHDRSWHKDDSSNQVWWITVASVPSYNIYMSNLKMM